jgi:hypothetical protein
MLFDKVKAILKDKKYKLFTRPYELNIVGMRNRSTIPNSFDDELHVFYKVNTVKWEYHVFRITTDPGTYWLRNPLQPQGTAILPEGQYVNTYQLGLHKGQYEALVEAKPITVIRDYDRNATLDFYNGKKYTGWFGINIHRANRVGTTKTIDKNSAGCQVFANATDFAKFIKLCQQHKSRFGNTFTYTLIDFRSVLKRNLKVAAISIGVLTGLGVATGLYFKNK